MKAEVFRPQFSTSASAAERKKEKRHSYFGDNLRTVVAKDEPKTS